MHSPPRKQTASHKTQIHLWRNWRSPAAPGCLGLVVLSSELIEWNRASEMICAMLKNPLEVALSIIKTIFGAYGWPRMAVHYCRHGEEFTGSKWMKDAASPKRNAAKGFWFHWISSRFKPPRKTRIVESWLTFLGCPNNFEHYVAMHPVQFVALQNMNPFRKAAAELCKCRWLLILSPQDLTFDCYDFL